MIWHDESGTDHLADKDVATRMLSERGQWVTAWHLPDGTTRACPDGVIPDDLPPGAWGLAESKTRPEPLADLTRWHYVLNDGGRRWADWGPEVASTASRHTATLTVRTDPATGEPVVKIERVTP